MTAAPCLYVPAGFDPAAYLPESLRDRADFARFFLHRIVWAKVFRLDEQDGFVALKAEYLRKFAASNRAYGDVKQALLGSGAIVTDGRFIVGSKCLGYRLGAGLESRRVERVAVADPDLADKIRRERSNQISSLNDLEKHLRANLQSLTIEADDAIDFIRTHGLSIEVESAVAFLRDHDIHFRRCDFGRVHSNVTNLKREVRQFLRVGGEPLVITDVKNSQPLFLAKLLKDKYEYGPEHTKAVVPPDVVDYVAACERGEFYDRLMEAGDIPPVQRPEFKRRFYPVLFGSAAWTSRQHEVFDGLYPNAAALVHEMKTPDHRLLAHGLQRAESRVMIDGVARRLMAERPHVPLYTIHDAVATTAEFADEVAAVMADEFACVGLHPTLTVAAA